MRACRSAWLIGRWSGVVDGSAVEVWCIGFPIPAVPIATLCIICRGSRRAHTVQPPHMAQILFVINRTAENILLHFPEYLARQKAVRASLVCYSNPFNS